MKILEFSKLLCCGCPFEEKYSKNALLPPLINFGLGHLKSFVAKMLK